MLELGKKYLTQSGELITIVEGNYNVSTENYRYWDSNNTYYAPDTPHNLTNYREPSRSDGKPFALTMEEINYE